MKKLTVLLVLILIAVLPVSRAEDLSALDDRELMILHQEVLDELERRGIQYGDESIPSMPEAAGEDEIVLRRMGDFFAAWYEFNMDDMLSLCLPEWKAETGNPRPALFQLLLNRTPLYYIVEYVSGDADGDVRTVQVSSEMDRNNGRDPVRYRMRIRMRKSADGLWDVDPRSLQEAETLTDWIPVLPTPEPAEEEEKAISGSTLLYYVPEGGQYYHLDPDCKTVNPKFLPMEGCFTYAEVNDEPYRDRMPCQVCGAPPREE